MSLFDLQDVCIAIGSLATLDLPMVVDLIGIYVLKGPYCTLTTTNWFLQALSVIPRGSWGDVSRHFTMIRWANRSDQIVDRSYDEVTLIGMNRMFIRWTGPAPGPMGRFKPITPILSLEPRVAYHNSTPTNPRPNLAAAPSSKATRRRRLAPPCAAASCRDRTCSDQLDEEFPSVLNSSVLLVQAEEGVLNPIADLIDDLPPPTV
ncbi:F-box/kelch-repeat protein-like [Dorcoceras hygrometricum]|uniref:F-box/kelch-repeat protein-like n=1 Tax=Dorcoceras hygrometricum TaxID=472368 RepID=A0A2Z7BX79_9LAMI|nr:F-box/kelch-repeat protein-like [Dorcoceras hygrometricum]